MSEGLGPILIGGDAKAKSSRNLVELRETMDSPDQLTRLTPAVGGPQCCFFFSKRLGCLGSLLVSVLVTLVLLFMFGMLRF